ncbi:hypothetical protein TNCT_246141 [Trichonephila clavata]|uniref:Uncharacterized protein n=1 Tax=Trichonephila clavata TaxID=2740835 RepID=A0A8X6KG27_TRICU|nr:hypothetical protein TNCT_246141 [Trichonephila clavata]
MDVFVWTSSFGICGFRVREPSRSKGAIFRRERPPFAIPSKIDKKKSYGATTETEISFSSPRRALPSEAKFESGALKKFRFRKKKSDPAGSNPADPNRGASKLRNPAFRRAK